VKSMNRNLDQRLPSCVCMHLDGLNETGPALRGSPRPNIARLLLLQSAAGSIHATRWLWWLMNAFQAVEANPDESGRRLSGIMEKQRRL
jgi:hypothetical protein